MRCSTSYPLRPLLFFILFLGLTQFVFSQRDFEYKIDTTTFKIAPRFYVTDLTLTLLENNEEIELSWKVHKNVRYFMIEIQDEESGALIYRQKHNHNRLVFPKKGIFSITPLANRQQGIPLSISLEEAIARDFEPKNTALYYQREDRKRKKELRDEQRKAAFKVQQQQEQKEHDFISGVVGISVFVVTAFFALIIVIVIWLINRKKSKPVVKSIYNKEFDKDFERKS